MKKLPEAISPSAFYRKIRPEYFSDSETIYETHLPKEHLAFELNNISINQKHDAFEVFCRKLCEKFITPNLIPQVGPTGGGDGKTDFETHPVSEDISTRWFVPENGWNKDEKWAFAISAKKDWLSKVKEDVTKIIKTGREYTKIFFLTNQAPSSKAKKNYQDQAKTELNIELIILDAKWLIEKVYDNQLFDLAVDCLNLSEIYKRKNVKSGKNDVERLARLEELEKKITDSNRYFKYDYQLVEDALESAILSRMLERSRDEVEGRFDRAFRFGQEVKNDKQIIRIYYQRAWTSVHWYNDYEKFTFYYRAFRRLVSSEATIDELELTFNLLNILRGISARQLYNEDIYGLNVETELSEFDELLSGIAKNENKPSTSLVAKTYLSLNLMLRSLDRPDKHFFALSEYLDASQSHLEYPFELFKNIIEKFGVLFPANKHFDKLYDKIANISAMRNSQLEAGEMFLKRGAQKLSANYNIESIVYFGKAILKLAKEETSNGLFLALRGMEQAYAAVGLLWASNACLVAAMAIPVKQWYSKGVITKRIYECANQLVQNELLIGRIPSLFTWIELQGVIAKQIDFPADLDENNSAEIMDGCLAVRILHSNDSDHALSLLPMICKGLDLELSQDASLFKMGYIDEIKETLKDSEYDNDDKIEIFFSKLAQQPFLEQIKYQTNFLETDQIVFTSVIMGCTFSVHFYKDKDLLLSAELILAFLEGFFSTSLNEAYPSSPIISIQMIKNEVIEGIKFSKTERSHSYNLELSAKTFSNPSESLSSELYHFALTIMGTNLMVEDIKEHFKNLFEQEEIAQRLSILLEHKTFMTNILGKNPKVLFEDWTKNSTIKNYPTKRKAPLKFEVNINASSSTKREKEDTVDRHDQLKVISIIDSTTWDQAMWNGFGYFKDHFGEGIFLAFNNEIAGKQIFENWIKDFGSTDNKKVIRIAVIKGINKFNPHWYRVHISSNFEEKSAKEGDRIVSTTRFQEFHPNTSNNILELTRMLEYKMPFRICPAKILSTGQMEPITELSINKSIFQIKNAWEISENDLDQVTIFATDIPVIPENMDDPPILKVLSSKKKG